MKACARAELQLKSVENHGKTYGIRWHGKLKPKTSVKSDSNESRRQRYHHHNNTAIKMRNKTSGLYGNHLQKASLALWLKLVFELLLFPCSKVQLFAEESPVFPWVSLPGKAFLKIPTIAVRNHCNGNVFLSTFFLNLLLQHFRSAIQTQLGGVVHLLCQSVVVCLLLLRARPWGVYKSRELPETHPHLD